MENADLEAGLKRITESVIFLLKADGLALGSLVTLASVFKLDPAQALGTATKLTWMLSGLAWLIAAGLGLLAVLTVVSRTEEGDDHRTSFNACRVLYVALVIGHLYGLVYGAGWIKGFLTARERLTGAAESTSAAAAGPQGRPPSDSSRQPRTGTEDTDA